MLILAFFKKMDYLKFAELLACFFPHEIILILLTMSVRHRTLHYNIFQKILTFIKWMVSTINFHLTCHFKITALPLQNLYSPSLCCVTFLTLVWEKVWLSTECPAAADINGRHYYYTRPTFVNNTRDVLNSCGVTHK